MDKPQTHASVRRPVRRFMLGDSTCKTPEECLQEHLAARVPSTGGGQVQSQLISKLGKDGYGRLLDQLGRTAKPKPRRRRPRSRA